MPGGPKRLEEREHEGFITPFVAPSVGEEEQRWEAAMVVWRGARQFQRHAKRVARSSGITFARLQVLDVTERLNRHQNEPVSEQTVAREAHVAKSSVSELMRGLMLQGLVDIGPDAWGVSYRIWVTEKGRELVEKLRGELVDAASVLALESATKARR